jgi:hypothetical protein
LGWRRFGAARLRKIPGENLLSSFPQLPGLPDRSLPARIDAAQGFNPEFIRWFAPGERVIWHGRSKGFNFTSQQFVILAIYGAIGALPTWVWVFNTDPDQRLIKDTAFIVIAMIWGVGLVHAWWIQVTAPFLAEAVLTDRRLYVRKGVFRRQIRRYGGARDKISYRIRLLRLTGRYDRALLKLRGFMANATGPVMLRVENPAHVAELIKATLHLEVPIRDLTTKRVTDVS